VFGLALSTRERRTIALGAIIFLTGLIVAFGVLPFVRHWQERESVVAAQSQRLSRLRGLVFGEAELRRVVRARTAALESGQQRLLSGRTPALAASSLQGLIQSFADQSQVTVSRLDVAGAPETKEGALPMIPATVSAIGDIYGITEMLALIQHGPQLLEIVDLTVRPNPALRGELLQMTVTLRGAYLGE
jgi:hypothetical protein